MKIGESDIIGSSNDKCSSNSKCINRCSQLEFFAAIPICKEEGPLLSCNEQSRFSQGCLGPLKGI